MGHFLFEYYIPRIKDGAFYYGMKNYMDRNPHASFNDLKREARAISMSTDNRFGMMQADNTFWHAIMKDSLHMAFLSAGWQTAHIREVMGAAYDIKQALKYHDPDFLSRRVAYVLGASMGTAMIGGAITYMLGGRVPTSLKDYFWPMTGGSNPDGSEERIMLPGHEKDIAELIDIYTAPPQDKLKTIGRVLSGKMNPFLPLAYQALTGEDYKGNPLDPTDDTTTTLQRIGEHWAQGITPIPFQHQLHGDQSRLGKLTDIAGIRPAPTRYAHPEAFEFGKLGHAVAQQRSKVAADRHLLVDYPNDTTVQSQLDRDQQDLQTLIEKRQDAKDAYEETLPGGKKYHGTLNP